MTPLRALWPSGSNPLRWALLLRAAKQKTAARFQALKPQPSPWKAQCVVCVWCVVRGASDVLPLGQKSTTVLEPSWRPFVATVAVAVASAVELKLKLKLRSRRSYKEQSGPSIVRRAGALSGSCQATHFVIFWFCARNKGKQRRHGEAEMGHGDGKEDMVTVVGMGVGFEA